MILWCTSKLRMRARAGASALAAMRKDACVNADVAADGDADEPPFTWPSQPDHRHGVRSKVIEDRRHTNLDIIFGESVRVEVGEVCARPLIRSIVRSVRDTRVDGDSNG